MIEVVSSADPETRLTGFVEKFEPKHRSPIRAVVPLSVRGADMMKCTWRLSVGHTDEGSVVRKQSFVWLFVFVITVTCAAAQRGADGSTPGEQFVGTWSGSWDGGGGSGGFELTLEKAKDGALAGRLSVTGEPTYKVTLKTVSFDGAKMSAKYDFPPAEGAEVILAATFDGKSAKGTWSVRDKAKGNEAVNGTWTVAKK